MKSLSLEVPKVLFLIGVPGTGKTYFAKKFSKTFAAPFIEVEAIRHAMTNAPTYNTSEQKSVDSVAALLFSEMLKTGKTFLYEGGLEARSDRMKVTKQVRDAGYEPMFIWVQTEPSTAKQRAVKGVRGHENILIPEGRFEQLVQRFTSPNALEKAVVISGKHTYASQAKKILNHLASTRLQQNTEGKLRIPERKQERPGSIAITQS